MCGRLERIWGSLSSILLWEMVSSVDIISHMMEVLNNESYYTK